MVRDETGNSTTRRVTRRFVVGAALAAPVVLRAQNALSQSEILRVYAWRDYIPRRLIDQFESRTGVNVILTAYGSNDEAETTLRNAGGVGQDVIFPSMTHAAGYDDPEAPEGSFLAPIASLNIDASSVGSAFQRHASEIGVRGDGAQVLIPFAWGAEGVSVNRNRHGLSDREISYGALWAPEASGRATMRPESGLIGVGLYLDARGIVRSNRLKAAERSVDDAQRIYGAITNWIIQRKENIGALWSDFDEAVAAFQEKDCTIGQTWDATGRALNTANPDVVFRAPREGLIGWMDAVAVPSKSTNKSRARTFIEFLLQPENAAVFAQHTGYNSAVETAHTHFSALEATRHETMFTPEALANVWWWRAEPAFVSQIREEFAAQIKEAWEG